MMHNPRADVWNRSAFGQKKVPTTTTATTTSEVFLVTEALLENAAY